MPNVHIHDEPDRLVAALAHKGAYSGITSVMEKAGALIAERRCLQDVAEVICIYHDNPQHVAEENLRSHAGFSLKDGRHPAEGFEALHLEGGRYAVCRHTGAYEGLAQTYDWLLNDWLPKSGEEFGGASMFEVYVNSPMDTPAEQLETLIYLPLEDEDFNGPI